MYKRCNLFPTEYQHEFIKRKIWKREPIRPTLDWESKDDKEPKSFDEKSKELILKFILERLQTHYQLNFKDRSERDKQEEEVDSGNELIAYLNNLYYKPHPEKTYRLPYTATRMFGYAASQTLHAPLSSYQDTYGRTGGEVILKNVQKMMAIKRRRIIESKLRSNTSFDD